MTTMIEMDFKVALEGLWSSSALSNLYSYSKSDVNNYSHKSPAEKMWSPPAITSVVAVAAAAVVVVVVVVVVLRPG